MKREIKISGGAIQHPDGSSEPLEAGTQELLDAVGEDIREGLRARLGLSEGDKIIKMSHDVRTGAWTTTVEMTRIWPDGLTWGTRNQDLLTSNEQ